MAQDPKELLLKKLLENSAIKRVGKDIIESNCKLALECAEDNDLDDFINNYGLIFDTDVLNIVYTLYRNDTHLSEESITLLKQSLNNLQCKDGLSIFNTAINVILGVVFSPFTALQWLAHKATGGIIPDSYLLQNRGGRNAYFMFGAKQYAEWTIAQFKNEIGVLASHEPVEFFKQKYVLNKVKKYPDPEDYCALNIYLIEYEDKYIYSYLDRNSEIQHGEIEKNQGKTEEDISNSLVDSITAQESEEFDYHL